MRYASLFLTCLFALAACGESFEPGTGTQQTEGRTFSAFCCLNGAYHTCGSTEAADQCFEDKDGSVCSRDASQDAKCSTSSPSNNTNPPTSNNTNPPNDPPSNPPPADETRPIDSPCQANNQCAGFICVVSNSTDTLGYCSKSCDSFTECPTFWSCESVNGASGRFCVKP